jgi:RHS repeat-associated protein
VTDVTDASGTAQWRYAYEAYGAPLSTTNVSGTAPENRLRFTSQYLDGETGDYHLRARQYDPATGRFDALDSVEPSMTSALDSAYVYVAGRPTVLTDPLGLCWGPDAVCKKAQAALGTAGDLAKQGGKVIGNTAAGAADYASFGVSTAGLNAVGIHPNTDSASFRVGQGIGLAATTLAGGYGTARGVLAITRAVAAGGLRSARPMLVRAALSGGLTAGLGYGASRLICSDYSAQTALLDFTLGGLAGPRSRSLARGFAAEEGSGAISMYEAIERGAAHVGPNGVMETAGKGLNYQFRSMSTDAAGRPVARIGRLDVNPADAHVSRLGPHLNLETQVDGNIVSNTHTPIDPATIRPGDMP